MDFIEETISIAVSDSQSITAIKTLLGGPSAGWLFVYAPGAGSSLNDGFGKYASGKLAEEALGTVRFQFPYSEAGKRRPDPPALLEDTWRAVIDTARSEKLRLVVGGRSMGGCMASRVVALGVEVDALALFAYPLYPPNDPSNWRIKHLPDIKVPTLFCSGTRDTFGTPEELEQAASLVPHSKLHLLEGADHGFTPLKSSGRKREDVWAEAVSVLIDWLSALTGTE